MGKVETYSQLIQTLLAERAEHEDIGGEIEPQLIFDTERHHYLLMSEGWRKQKHRIYGITIHMDIKDDGKIWVQWNGTEEDFLETLTNKGVPIVDIVNGMHMPHMREWRKTYRE